MNLVLNGARPIQLNSSSPAAATTFKTSIETYKIFVAPHARDTQNAINALTLDGPGNGWIGSAPALSTASITVLGTTFTSSLGDFGTWAPTVLAFNNKNIGTYGEINDNTTTLQNENVEFSIDLKTTG